MILNFLYYQVLAHFIIVQIGSLRGATDGLRRRTKIEIKEDREEARELVGDNNDGVIADGQ